MILDVSVFEFQCAGVMFTQGCSKYNKINHSHSISFVYHQLYVAIYFTREVHM